MTAPSGAFKWHPVRQDGRVLVPAEEVTHLLRWHAANWAEDAGGEPNPAIRSGIAGAAALVAQIADDVDIELIGWLSRQPQ